MSRLLGFARSFVLTIVFAGQLNLIGNALTVSSQLPASLYALIGGGLINAVLVPQTVRASRGDDGGAAFINKLITITVFIVFALTAMLTLATPLLMRLAVSSESTYRVAVPLAYWAMPQIFFLGIYAVLGEVLNARQRFGAYTWAPVANNIVAVALLGAYLLIFGTISPLWNTPLTPTQTALLAGAQHWVSRCRH